MAAYRNNERRAGTAGDSCSTMRGSTVEQPVLSCSGFGSKIIKTLMVMGLTIGALVGC
jgi:hypothetical protein